MTPAAAALLTALAATTVLAVVLSPAARESAREIAPTVRAAP